jgi:hypothetical protein
MQLSYFRIQNEAAAMDEYEEEVLEPAECSQQSLEETTSLAVTSQHGAPKSYKCQLCNEIFLSVHQLFSHELRDHEHIGTSQIDHIKKPLPKYNQHEKVFSSKNEVRQTQIHDTNPRAEASETKNSQKQEGNPQTHTSDMGGKSQKQDGNQRTDASNMGMHTSSMGGKAQEQDGNQQTHTSNMEGSLNRQVGNQETHTSNVEGKSQKQDGNQTHTSNMEGSLKRQVGNQETHTSNVEGKSQKQDGNQDRKSVV